MKQFDDFVFTPDSQKKYQDYLEELDKDELLKIHEVSLSNKLREELIGNFKHDYDIRLIYSTFEIKWRMSH